MKSIIKIFKKLDLFGNRIKIIEGLDNLTNVKFLYLTFNQIPEIQDLDALTNLEQLYIERNKISQIKGLDNLHNLKELKIQYNSPFDDDSIKLLEDMRNSGIRIQYW